MKKIIQNSWQDILQPYFETDAYQHLRTFLKQEYQTQTIYPDMYHIYEALQQTPYEKVKVVIIGQDPYHGPQQAHGMSFSVQPQVAIPPSLQNIYQELESDLGIPPASHGHLTAWATQGVLLLNNVLTVRRNQAHSHKGKGWENFTQYVIERLNERTEPIVFILWGKAAKEKATFLDTGKHFIICSSHPSPYSADYGFFGSKPFSRTNTYLQQAGMEPIDWRIPPQK
ncbi:uracil-DNA glycosylase [Isobaculum melis]|uniref:Uracil-DNA glycosylase n=1 Tax=Isobaculum melis TaxID=142588 RepID=A0A1H9SS87_9LACT|nr:uracil-DNA glycosylase [Isobaculum melis]SER87892.1 Uracil-DNA glycosylase [Isobaculum melis]